MDSLAPAARLTRPEPRPKRVLVATDTSPTSAGAERAGIELSSRVGASLILLSVIDPNRLWLPGGIFHTRVDQVRTERETSLARVVAQARQLGVAAQFLIWEGDPGASVIDAAEAEGADVVVVGNHARGQVGRLLLGSVSRYVVEHERRPVIVIRPGERLDDVWPMPLPNGVTYGPLGPGPVDHQKGPGVIWSPNRPRVTLRASDRRNYREREFGS